MAKQALFYEEVMPIRADRHLKHAATLGTDFGFASGHHLSLGGQ